jgi:hypothetical protein
MEKYTYFHVEPKNEKGYLLKFMNTFRVINLVLSKNPLLFHSQS